MNIDTVGHLGDQVQTHESSGVHEAGLYRCNICATTWSGPQPIRLRVIVEVSYMF